jgi:hypothetical protein
LLARINAVTWHVSSNSSVSSKVSKESFGTLSGHRAELRLTWHEKSVFTTEAMRHLLARINAVTWHVSGMWRGWSALFTKWERDF